MKTLWKSLFILALGAFAFSSCEDVPEPYPTPGQGNGGTETPTEPIGDGTLANPFNCIAANQYIENNLAEGETSTEAIYIKGKVVSIKENFTTQYGNAAFYISEDGKNKNTFYVYRALYLGNVKYTSGDVLEAGDEVIVCGKVTNYNGTYETVQNGAYVYSINGKTADGEPTTPGEPTGEGTQASPYNVAAALNIIKALDASAQTEPMYVKGKISSIKSVETAQYGNANYYISDDGTNSNELYIFQSFYLGNVKFTSADQIKVGDEVVIYGPFVNYMGNTPETAGKGASYIYSLNGKTADNGGSEDPTPGEATGDGTLESPFNSVAANNYASSLAAGEISSEDVYIKGKIVSIKENFTAQYGNAAFYISDDGTSANQFYVFRTLYLNNEKYTEGDVLSVGDDVVICGKVTNYMGNTPETAQNESYLYSWTKNGGSGDIPGGGEVSENSITITASSLGLANATEVGTQTLSDGTTLTFVGGGNNNVPKYYTAGNNIRMYPKNSLTIKASKKITSVIFNFDTYQGTICNASGDISADPGSVTVKESVGTISDIDATETTITNTSGTSGAPSQMRITSITINYAD
ncbi:MAG: hypothetical protein K2N13_01730 [Paraprevotella sp.]|nr:hypothetical protein [Paraprevotella sp.]